MLKYSLQEMLATADKGGWAIPSFNYSDIWELLAIVEAAREERAPVVVQSHMKIVKTFSIEWLGALGRGVMENSDSPVINHLDHSTDLQMCLSAIDNGYASVMFDGSPLDLDANIENTKKVIAHAAGTGVCVEAEIGKIKGNTAEGTFTGGEFLVRVEDAVRMAEETGCNSLAIGLGNAHGFYTEKPQLNFQRLKEVNDAVKIPLVLHGGTGIPDADIQHAIKNGINKVNVGTHLHHTYIQNARKVLEDEKVSTNVLDLMVPVKEAIKAPVKHWIHVCMANNRI